MAARTRPVGGVFRGAIIAMICAFAALPSAASADTITPGTATLSPGWLSPNTFSNASRSATGEVGAVMPNGTVIVMWQEKVSSTEYQVLVGSRRPDGAFAPVTLLETSATPFTNLQVAADAVGNILAVWCSGGLCSNLSPTSTIRYMRIPGDRYAETDPVAHPVEPEEVAYPLTANGYQPSLSIAPDGTTVLAYAKHDGIYVSKSDIAAGPPPPGSRVDETFSSSPTPVVATNASGATVLLYVGRDAAPDATPGLNALRLPAGATTWTDLGVVDEVPPHGGSMSAPRLSLDASGNALATWKTTDPDTDPPDPENPPSPENPPEEPAPVETLKVGLWPIGNTTGFDPIVATRTAAPGIFGTPAVAFDGTGLGHIVYTRNEPDGTSSINHGPITGPDDQIEESIEEYAASAIALLGDDSLMLAVIRGTNIIGARIAPATPISFERVGIANHLSAPAVLAAPGPDAVVLWDEGAIGTDQRVKFAPYDATAPVLLNTTTPATAVAGKPAGVRTEAFDLWKTPSISWLFGDGSAGFGYVATRTYTAAGNHMITVTATDAVGNRVTSDDIPIKIEPAPPKPPPPTPDPPKEEPTPDPPKEEPKQETPKADDAPAADNGSGAQPRPGSGGSPGGSGANGGSSGTTGSSTGNGSGKTARASLFPLGRVALKKATVRAGYGILCDAAGSKCTVNGIARHGKRKLGTFTLRLAPGRTAVLRFKLSKPGYRLLVRKRKLRVRIAASGVKGLPKSIVVKAPKAKKKKPTRRATRG